MNISGLVNGMNVRFAVDDLKKKRDEMVRNLEERWEIIKQRITYSSQVSKTLPNAFFYLETEEDLMVHGTNISKVDVTYPNEKMIKLDMKNERPGRFCELPDHCPCPYQSTVEFSDDDTHTAWRLKHEEVIKRFYDQDDNLEISVMTTAVSSSVECTLTTPKREHIMISIVRFKDTEDILHIAFDDIEGYLKDATFFKYEGTRSYTSKHCIINQNDDFRFRKINVKFNLQAIRT